MTTPAAHQPRPDHPAARTILIRHLAPPPGTPRPPTLQDLVAAILDDLSPHLAHTATTPRRADQPKITAHQHAVLRGIAAGHNNRRIGATLYISEDTVKTHARRLYAALGAHDRASAVHIGHQTGLLP